MSFDELSLSLHRHIMLVLVLVALVLGGLIIFLVQKNRNQVLKTEDGWWGAGAPPDAQEDVTIRPFKVTTSDEELEVELPPVCHAGLKLLSMSS